MPFIDPLYLILVAPAFLLAMWAQFQVKSAYHKGSQVASRAGVTGAQTALNILRQNGINSVAVEEGHGFLSDHYDPRAKVIRLSPEVYHGNSLAALGIAAHEVGHAIQDAQKYAPLTIRNLIVPTAAFGSNAAIFMFFGGLLLGAAQGIGHFLVIGAIVLYSAVVVFQLVNLPVEFDASARARKQLADLGLVTRDEAPVVRSVLSAAALTYVAATLTAVLTLIYFILRAKQQQ